MNTNNTTYNITVQKFQAIVNVLAQIINVPSALIMRLSDNEISVFASSISSGNPYQIGAKEHFDGSGLYCEHVIKSNNMLLIPNALKNEKWKNNPDIKLNMISYLGLPILLPSGKTFGTICVLDNKTNHYSDIYIELLLTMRDLVEFYFVSLHNEIVETKTKTLKATVRSVMDLVNNALNNMNYFSLKMQESNDFTEEDIALFKNIIFSCSRNLKSLCDLSEINIKEESFGDIIDFEKINISI